MFYWIYDYPNWSLALMLCAATLAFTWTGLIASRPWVRRLMADQPGGNDLVSYFVSAYGVFYGLTLGLIAVGTYENFNSTEGTVSREASTLNALLGDVSVYPEPIRRELKGDLKDYCDYVIDKAWPIQKRGEVPTGGDAIITRFVNRLAAFEPATKGQEMIHGDTFRQLNTFIEARRSRLSAVTTGLPAALWYVVGVGALLNIVLTWMFSLESLKLHLILTGLLAILIGLLIFLVAAMDNPFRGEFSVSSEPFEILRDSLKRVGATARN
jgi:hypothetical protein